MGISDYLENKILDATLRNVPYTSPATVYLALFTADPTDAATGTEVAGGAYARKPVTFGAPVNGLVSNDTDILFDIATANWGTITHLAVIDALTLGNMLYFGAVTTAKTINTDDQLKFTAGSLSISLD